MRYLKQLSIILLISFLGELLHALLPLPIPASIYGLILMLTCLCTGVISVASVKETANFLIEIMPLMFIPAAVGLMDSWGILQPVCIPYVIIIMVSTIVVMGAAGLATQAVIRHERRKHHE